MSLDKKAVAFLIDLAYQEAQGSWRRLFFAGILLVT